MQEHVRLPRDARVPGRDQHACLLTAADHILSVWYALLRTTFASSADCGGQCAVRHLVHPALTVSSKREGDLGEDL